MVFISFSICGCGHKASEEKKVVARINNYDLTVEDFKDSAGLAMADQYVSETPEKAKERLLEELVVKNILVQEAQAQNFDKDTAFMKEIEHYWEQALLKLLIKKKTEEFARKVTEGDEKTKREKVRQILEKWVMDLRNNARVKIYKENLETIRIK